MNRLFYIVVVNLRVRLNANVRFVVFFLSEDNFTVYQCE